MRSAIALRATVSRCSSSACKACCASAVMTTRSLKRIILILWLKAAPPFPVIADRHQRVRDPRAEHEIAGVAREGDRRRGARHGDRRGCGGGGGGPPAPPS